MRYEFKELQRACLWYLHKTIIFLIHHFQCVFIRNNFFIATITSIGNGEAANKHIENVIQYDVAKTLLLY